MMMHAVKVARALMALSPKAFPPLLSLCWLTLAPIAARAESIDLRSDWLFTKGDVTDAAAVQFDDAAWTTVRLPHDWAIEGPVNPEQNGSTGKLPWRGVGWYRKSFTLNAEPNSRVYLDFDGVMAFPKIYVNGHLAGEWDYGYTSFRVDATPFVNLDGQNVIAIRVDTTKHKSRWYPGAGIYRKVTLDIRRPVHVAHWGVQVTTPEISDSSATADIEAKIENHSSGPLEAITDFLIIGPDGKTPAASRQQQVTLKPGENEIRTSLKVSSPQRWDVDQPRLYRLVTKISQGAKPLDEQTTLFGFRTIKLTADEGLHLNGRRVQIKGVNLHHDQGPLGAAFYPRAMERQLKIMRDMGANALRTSHNPPAPEMLDLCDRLGILVWEEAFDKWDETADRVAGRPSLEEHAERQLRSMVLRDRNHPSVFVWSIGNEISEGREGVTRQRIAMMRNVVRKFDDTRPVGMGCHIPEQALGALLADLDFTGWNYMRRYARYHERFPDKPIIYSESASALSTRGFYELPLPKTKTDFSKQRQVNSYDFNAAAWADIPDAEFRRMSQDKFVAGEFVWTGFDYLGEPTPFEQQAKSSYFGIVDLCGIPKDRYYLYRSYWRPEESTIHILPHWNWPDHVSQTIPVFVYTNADEAEVFLNGKSQGRRRKREVPPRPENFARTKAADASSWQPGHPPTAAQDEDENTRWSAASSSIDQCLEVDLAEKKPLKCFVIEFEREAKNYGYTIEASDDRAQWKTYVTQSASNAPPWGGPRTAVHDVHAEGRYLRIRFNELRAGAWASIREFRAYPQRVEAPYFDVAYDYRLRWNEVRYEPGELKAVA
jgi:beta-galactosidase